MAKTMTVTVPPTALDQAWNRIAAEANARLEARIAEHGIKVTPYMPMGDNILVLRLPAPPKETQTKGGLFIPETSQEEPEPLSEGILIQAGCSARDILRDHGIMLGDLVQIGRFAGWEKEFKADASGKGGKRILQMNVRDVLGSVDLHTRLWGPDRTMCIVMDDETDEHRIVPIVDPED